MAAAFALLVVGLAVVRRGSDPLVTTTPPTAGPGTSVVAKPGGIFDPESPALQNESVQGLAVIDERVYIATTGMVRTGTGSSLLVADAYDGSLLAQHTLAPGIGAATNSLVVAGGRVWMISLGTENNEAESSLWSVTGLDPPRRVLMSLDRWYSLGADDDTLVLQADGEFQRRSSANGALIDSAPWTGAGLPYDGWSSVQAESAVVRRNGATREQVFAFDRSVGQPSFVRSFQDRLVVAQGGDLVVLDVDTGREIRRQSMGGDIMSVDRNGGFVWAAATTVDSPPGKPTSAASYSWSSVATRLDLTTGTIDSWDLDSYGFPKVAARPDGSAIACFNASNKLDEPNSLLRFGCQKLTTRGRSTTASDPAIASTPSSAGGNIGPEIADGPNAKDTTGAVAVEDLGGGWQRTGPWEGLSVPGTNGEERGQFSVVAGQIGDQRLVLVWGGKVDGVGTRDDGAQFDPQTNRWESLPPAPLTARADHVAVWTGREIVVWGGLVRDKANRAEVLTEHNDGAAYDPETRAWRTIARSPLAGGGGYSTVWTGTEMVVVGGTSGSYAVLGQTPTIRRNEAAAYNPGTNTWRRLPGLPVDLSFVKAHWTGTDVVIAGGQSVNDLTVGTFRSEVLVASLDLTDTTGDVDAAWRVAPPGGPSAQSADSAWVGDRLLVATYYPPTSPSRFWLASSNTWVDIPGYPLTRGCEGIPAVISISAGALVEVCGEVARFDATTDSWSIITPKVEDGSGFGLSSRSTVFTGNEVVAMSGDGRTTSWRP